MNAATLKGRVLIGTRLTLTLPLMAWLFSSCASHPGTGRVFLDSTTHEDDLPDWAQKTKMVWEKDGKIFVRGEHTVRGDERVNGCFDLARLDVKEAILSEIANNVKGSIDNAQQSISENAEVVLGKVRSGEFEGQLTGLRFTDEYYERYKIADVERLDCHALAEIKNSDYERVRRAVVDKVAAVDPRLKEAITKKQIDFFQPKRDTTATKTQDESAED